MLGIWTYALEIRLRVLEDIEDMTAKILKVGKKPLMIGGEHLVTLGSIRAAVKHFPDLYDTF